MMRWLGWLLVLVLAMALGAQQPSSAIRPRLVVDEEFRPTLNAIDRGLEYLRKNQNANGSWSTKFGLNFADPWAQNQRAPRVNVAGDFAITALSIMAFLSAGHVPGEGPYGDVLTAGIQWMLENQQRDGRLCPTSGTEMYHHGICTLMLAEVVGMTTGTYAERLREALERAVVVILTAQRRGGNGRFGQASMTGGWRYSVNDAGFQGSDLSVTGWQLMALRAAKNVGCDVPSENIQAAVDYVKRSQDVRSGGFQYQPGGQVTVPCTGVGVLCLELSGKDYHLCDEALRGGAYILSKSQENQAHYYYGVYYMSQAMFQLGGNYWTAFRAKLQKNLLQLNAPLGDGSWPTVGDGGMYGGNYSTAMAILSLTVEYRYLPIYQRFEEPLERDGRE